MDNLTITLAVAIGATSVLYVLIWMIEHRGEKPK